MQNWLEKFFQASFILCGFLFSPHSLDIGIISSTEIREKLKHYLDQIYLVGTLNVWLFSFIVT